MKLNPSLMTSEYWPHCAWGKINFSLSGSMSFWCLKQRSRSFHGELISIGKIRRISLASDTKADPFRENLSWTKEGGEERQRRGHSRMKAGGPRAGRNWKVAAEAEVKWKMGVIANQEVGQDPVTVAGGISNGILPAVGNYKGKLESGMTFSRRSLWLLPG